MEVKIILVSLFIIICILIELGQALKKLRASYKGKGFVVLSIFLSLLIYGSFMLSFLISEGKIIDGDTREIQYYLMQSFSVLIILKVISSMIFNIKNDLSN